MASTFFASSSAAAYLLLVAVVPVCHGFSALSSRLHPLSPCRRAAFHSSLSLAASVDSTASVMAPSPFINDTDTIAWECDEDANCVQVPACSDEECRTSLDVRIHGKWYDLSGWRRAHPAGVHWIDWYDGRDATEVMDAFHTDKAKEMYKRLPESSSNVQAMLERTVPADTTTQVEFRNLQQTLQQEGWYERDVWHEVKLLSIWATLVTAAAMTAQTLPLLSTALLGLSMTNAGWLGHDYVHGVDDFSTKMRNFAALAAGLDPIWWSDKHNKHHALTNEMGVDEDIATDPFLYQWPPAPENDSPLRKIQHWIFFIPFSFLFVLWRVDSIKVAVNAIEAKRPNAKQELYCLLIHYAILLTIFPLSVWLPAVFMSGLMTALIVTPTHQSEQLFDDHPTDWVTAQFQTTRNAVLTNPFSTWLWGGMQYQLEHHLFPSMPRSKYPALRERIQDFARRLNIPGGYRESGEWEILKMNWDLYRRVAQADAIPGSPPTKGHVGQVAAIRSTTSPAAAADATNKKRQRLLKPTSSSDTIDDARTIPSLEKSSGLPVMTSGDVPSSNVVTVASESEYE